MLYPITEPQGFKELFEAMRDSTVAVQENTAMLQELLRGPLVGAALLLTLTVILFAWSWHLSRDVSLRGEKYRLLSAAGVLLVFVTALGAGSVHVAVVERPVLATILVNLCIFVPLLLLGGVGYGFDRSTVIAAADDAAVRAARARRLDTPVRNFAAGLGAAGAVVVLAHGVRRSGMAPETAQVVVLTAVLAALIVVLGVVWVRVRSVPGGAAATQDPTGTT